MNAKKNVQRMEGRLDVYPVQSRVAAGFSKYNYSQAFPDAHVILTYVHAHVHERADKKAQGQ